jgi:hypothetical protein
MEETLQRERAATQAWMEETLQRERAATQAWMEETLQRERAATQALMEETIKHERAAMEDTLQHERAAMQETLNRLRIKERAAAQAVVQRAMDDKHEVEAELASLKSAIITLAPRYADILMKSTAGHYLHANALIWLAERQALVAHGGRSCRASVGLHTYKV